jgi:hypothetical protein
MKSRRSFLKSGLMTALSVGFTIGAGRMVFGQGGARSNPAVDFAIPSEARQDTLFHYTQAAFESYLGSTFTATGADGRTVELVLVSVTGYTPKQSTRIMTKPRRESESFTLSFNASGLLPIFTTIHTLRHGALGDIDLFLVGRTTESGAIFYEATVNHAGTPSPSPKRTGPVYRKDESPRVAAPDSESPQ